MSDALERLFFPQDRDRLARLIPPSDDESDEDWLERLVTDRSAVLLTAADARDPRVYRARIREASGKVLIMVNEGETSETPDFAERTVFDGADYLARRRAGQSPHQATQNEERTRS